MHLGGGTCEGEVGIAIDFERGFSVIPGRYSTSRGGCQGFDQLCLDLVNVISIQLIERTTG